MLAVIQSGSSPGAGDEASVAVLLFAGTALLLLIVLIVAVLMIVTRRRRLGIRRDGREPAEPIADAWKEAARRAEPFDRPPDDD